MSVIVAALMLCGVFTACSKPVEEPSASPTQIVTETVAPTATPQPTPEIPTDVSPTTGLPGNTVYKPIIVQIDNAASARPQSGISYADIVYETDIDGYDTRLTALFNDALNGENAPGELVVGPVRSSRYYHQWIQGEWDALYVHMGGPDSTGMDETDIWGASAEHIQQRINGAGKHASNTEYFFALRDGKPASDYAGIDLIKALNVYNYDPVAKQAFTYYPLQDYADQPMVEKIAFTFSKDLGSISYGYDEGNDKMMRFVNHEEFTDATTGDQVGVQNLIVQFVNDKAANDAPQSDRRIVDVEGSGKALFLIHGKLMEGTWERPSYDDKTTYKLASGEEVTLTPGNTWIEMHPTGKDVQVTMADGTEQTFTGE